MTRATHTHTTQKTWRDTQTPNLHNTHPLPAVPAQHTSRAPPPGSRALTGHMEAPTEAVPRTPLPVGQMTVLPCYLRLFPVLLVGIGFLQPNGNRLGTDPVPNLPNRLNRADILLISIR